MKKTIPILKNTAILPEINIPLLRWYRQQARILPWREDPTPYRVWISEIMLQQTRVEAVKPFFERFLRALPDIHALAGVEESRLLKLWEGLGYYNRARNLQKAARIICEKYQGNLPDNFAKLLTLPGIGRYTAGAISSIACGQRQAAVDGNVLRVITRILACPLDILKESTKRLIENALLQAMPAASEAGAFNQALMELGAMICLPKNPHCAHCPLLQLCLAAAEGCTDALPIKKRPKPRRIEKKTILLLRKGASIALHQRPNIGLLAGLWELPNVSGHLPREKLLSLLSSLGLKTTSVQALPPARHVFSHVEWYMIGWDICLTNIESVCESTAPDLTDPAMLSPLIFANRDALAVKYSIPTAFQYYLSKWQQEECRK